MKLLNVDKAELNEQDSQGDNTVVNLSVVPNLNISDDKQSPIEPIDINTSERSDYVVVR